METLEAVLDFCSSSNSALNSSPSVLKNVLGCSICKCLMLEPYATSCGHSFCRHCLQAWTKQQRANSTCPKCRQRIKSEPILMLGLRELALTVVASWNVANPEKYVPDSALALTKSVKFFERGELDEPLYDPEDDVWRCIRCNFELEDGACPSCGYVFPSHGERRGDFFSDVEYESDGSDFEFTRRYEDVREENRRLNETRGSAARAEATFPEARNTLGRTRSRSTGIYSSNPTSALHRLLDGRGYYEDDVVHEDPEIQSDIDMHEDDSRQFSSDSEPHSDDSIVDFVEDDEADASESNDGSSGFDVSDSEEDEPQTSDVDSSSGDDSLLEEARAKEIEESSSSEIEVVSVCRRANMVVDDDDE